MAEKIQTLDKKRHQPTSTGETQLTPTPRPWFLTPRGTPNETRDNFIQSLCIESEQGFVMRVSDLGHARTEPQRRADAEFICRAVNSFDDLLEALESAKSEMTPDGYTERARKAVVSQINRVLAKAKDHKP